MNPSTLPPETPTDRPMPTDADLQDIRALFLRQCAAESAHDLRVLDDVLLRSPPGEADPVAFVARAYTFWGRDALLEHFRTLFEGVWIMEPDETLLRVIPIGPDTAHIYAPCRVTVGELDKPPATANYLINEFAVRTPEGWKISTMVPVPTR